MKFVREFVVLDGEQFNWLFRWMVLSFSVTFELPTYRQVENSLSYSSCLAYGCRIMRESHCENPAFGLGLEGNGRDIDHV